MDAGDLKDEKESPKAEFNVNTTTETLKAEENTDKVEENESVKAIQAKQIEEKNDEFQGETDDRKDKEGKITVEEESKQVKDDHIKENNTEDENEIGQGVQIKIENELVDGKNLQVGQQDDEKIESKYEEGEHVEGEHVEGEHVEGEHIEVKNVEGEHAKGENVEGEHVKGEHEDGELVEGEIVGGEHVKREHEDGEVVEGENVDGEHVDGEHVDGELVEGEHKEGELTEGELENGELVEGEDKEGELIQGEHKEGELVEGEHKEGELVESEHEEGEQVKEDQSKKEYLEGEHVEGEITEGENLEGEEKNYEERVGEELQQEENVGEQVPEEDEYYEPDPAAPYDLTDSKEALRPPYKLRPDQIVELETLWQLYQDYTPAYSDIDNYITYKELIYMLKGLNLMTHTPEQVQELIDFCVRPAHPKGHINYDQYTHIMKIRFRDISAEEELRFALKVLDPDGTGIIDRELLKDVLSTKGNKMKHRALDNLIKEVDISQDGTLGIEDIVGTMAIDLNTEDLKMLRAAVYPPDKLLGHENENENKSHSPDDSSPE